MKSTRSSRHPLSLAGWFMVGPEFLPRNGEDCKPHPALTSVTAVLQAVYENSSFHPPGDWFLVLTIGSASRHVYGC